MAASFICEEIQVPTPFQGFMWIFGVTLLFGLLVGTLNLMNPEAVHIPFGRDENGVPQSAEGIDGILTSLASSAALGLLFGTFAAGLSFLFSLFFGKVKKG